MSTFPAGADRGWVVVGVDGCKGGWCVASATITSSSVSGETCEVFENFEAVIERFSDCRAMCVDIPIGLLDRAQPGGREVDSWARRELGSRKASSVFSAPIRPVLSSKSYEEALAISRGSSDVRRGLSKQAHAILPKITEVDRLLTPALQAKVVEVHPEVCFSWMKAGVNVEKKRLAEGHSARLAALREAGFGFVDAAIQRLARCAGVGKDDIVDAHAALWTARRFALAQAERFPRNPPLDSKGLRMEMWV